jgi:two-component system KDP operon response regulator KdpE
VPVILLSTCGEELAKVHGLELGADDYVVKPCGYFELLARIRALLRRGEGQAAPFEHPYVTGALRVDFARRGVTVDGQPVQLTGTEYRLLEVLARNAGRIVPYDRLLQRVWGDEGVEGPAFLKVFVYRLRRKIEPDPAHPRYLLTERGCGYWLSPAAESFRGSEQKGL